MFSGIVAAIGRITHLSARQDEQNTVRLTIAAGALGLDDVALGDSIACNGVCLTVVEKDGQHFRVDVSPETLSCTVGLDAPGEINLEKALRVSDRLGGHLVSGHVDGVGEVLRFDAVGEGEAICRLLEIRAPKAIAKYIAKKGSVTVNGTSLTTNDVRGTDFTINLIPHTLQHTTLHQIQPGSKVNLEVDLIARYCERLLNPEN
ncbi:MAG TPA: riboflavin synthase [Azospira sp.]|nr:riboflavin synthase [Azospira sp.]